jgi:hypothetical protein
MDGNTSQRGFSFAGLASRLLLENLKENSTKEGRRKVQRLSLKHMRNINRRPLSKNYLRQVISKWKENSSKKEKYLITMTRKTYRCLNMVPGRVGTKLIMLKK